MASLTSSHSSALATTLITSHVYSFPSATIPTFSSLPTSTAAICTSSSTASAGACNNSPYIDAWGWDWMYMIGIVPVGVCVLVWSCTAILKIFEWLGKWIPVRKLAWKNWIAARKSNKANRKAEKAEQMNIREEERIRKKVEAREEMLKKVGRGDVEGL